MHTILAFGTKVTIARVDMNGFCGRERHPRRADEGADGVVVQCLAADFMDLSEDLESTGAAREATEAHPNAGTVYGDEWAVCYLVATADGRMLEVMGHELG